MKVPIRNPRPICGCKNTKDDPKVVFFLCFSLNPCNDFQLIALLCPNLIHYQNWVFVLQSADFQRLLRRDRDSNPRYSCPYTAFRVRPDRPLRHLSFDQVAKIMIRSDYRCISGQKMLEILLSEQHASP